MKPNRTNEFDQFIKPIIEFTEDYLEAKAMFPDIIAQLEESLTHKRRINASLNEECRSLEEALRTVREEMRALRRENTNLRSLSAKNRSLTAENRSLRRENSELWRDSFLISKLIEQINELISQLLNLGVKPNIVPDEDLVLNPTPMHYLLYQYEHFKSTDGRTREDLLAVEVQLKQILNIRLRQTAIQVAEMQEQIVQYKRKIAKVMCSLSLDSIIGCSDEEKESIIQTNPDLLPDAMLIIESIQDDNIRAKAIKAFINRTRYVYRLRSKHWN